MLRGLSRGLGDVVGGGVFVGGLASEESPIDGVNGVLKRGDFGVGVLGEVGAFGVPSADHAVDVFDEAFLP